MQFSAGICIGINNYPGTDSDLGGCVNDAKDWQAALCPGATLLLDRQATKSAMLAGIARVVGGLKKGEWGLVTYSGHGSWVPDENGDEPDGRDEVLVPADWREDVLDDELADIWRTLTSGANVLFVNDSCMNGGVFRVALRHSDSHPRIRFLPPERRLATRRAGRAARILDTHPVALPRAAEAPLPGVVHMAGCRNTEYCYDARFGNRGNGAFTHAALLALTGTMSFSQWMAAIHKRLPSQSYPQTPVLNATPAMRRRPAPSNGARRDGHTA